MTLDANGLTVLRGADYLTIIRNSYETRTGLTVNWDRDLFLGNITAIVADRLGDLGQLEQAIYDARDVYNANGRQLDQLAGMFGLVRIPATFSTVTLRFTGDVGAAVPTATVVAGGGVDGLARWSTLTDEVIGADGTVDVIAQALVSGRTDAPSGAITIIATPRTNVDSVTNPGPAVPGAPLESDQALRARLLSTQQQPSAGTVAAIRRAMLTLPDVQQAVVIENATGTPQTVLGVLLPEHSVNIVVFPEQDTTAKQEAIARAIYEDGPRAGIEPVGTQSATVVGEDGRNKEVRWSHATTITLDIEIQLELDTGYSLAGVTPQINAAIAARSALQLIGQRVRYNTILCDILAVEGVVEVPSLTIDGVAGDYVTGALEIAQLNITGIS